jgi:hypothetical protein
LAHCGQHEQKKKQTNRLDLAHHREFSASCVAAT